MAEVKHLHSYFAMGRQLLILTVQVGQITNMDTDRHTDRAYWAIPASVNIHPPIPHAPFGLLYRPPVANTLFLKQISLLFVTRC